ncbi:hypothetical protein B0H12DRAFT_1081081 [Mycena haematopus]|nr:hypothetical protein B0H12DRAFT_1081081 [Mycena haematopus]
MTEGHPKTRDQLITLQEAGYWDPPTATLSHSDSLTDPWAVRMKDVISSRDPGGKFRTLCPRQEGGRNGNAARGVGRVRTFESGRVQRIRQGEYWLNTPSSTGPISPRGGPLPWTLVFKLRAKVREKRCRLRDTKAQCEGAKSCPKTPALRLAARWRCSPLSSGGDMHQRAGGAGQAAEQLGWCHGGGMEGRGNDGISSLILKALGKRTVSQPIPTTPDWQILSEILGFR